ncbi:DNA-binding protein RFX2 [Liparis tanakae]|uniref:DNA-binding protein RFX2 n=1 Tax=Liparis tanakae TaxID=230148 RepID=A0A4Z2FKS1_9TELE|nr:DNA-binding protein RFX2 [Liparis tanakae]
MQSSEGGSDTAASVATLRTSSSAQAPVVQPVPASQQRVLVQATGSAQKGGQVQQLSVPRVHQASQQVSVRHRVSSGSRWDAVASGDSLDECMVQQVQHVYPSQVQYVGESGETVYTNGTIRTAYSYNPEAQLYGQGSGGGAYFDSQAGGAHVTTVVSSAGGGVPPHGMVGITMDVGGSHIISSGSTYLIHGGSMEGSRNHISHSSRSSSAMRRYSSSNPAPRAHAQTPSRVRPAPRAVRVGSSGLRGPGAERP